LAKTVLIVEDEREIRDLVARYLSREGFDPVVAPDGESGFAKARSRLPDLILLDVLLPGMDGLELLRCIRADREISGTPVVMLTAKGEETDRIVGLEMGADDYISKPFSPREVVARVKAILRRGSRQAGAQAGEKVYVYQDLRLDTARHEVLDQGRPVSLTTKEFRILRELLSSPGRVLSREAILQKVWGDGISVIDRTVDVHIARLRQKIPLLAKTIHTVKDVGYKLQQS
jgi:two-component system alkaline phosphatase synthesis response regulator PhoP